MAEPSTARGLLARIEQERFTVSIVGLGYVGLPLALAFAEAGIRVTALDIDEDKIRRLRAGSSTIEGISSQAVQQVVSSGHLSPTSHYEDIEATDVAVICVPTPLTLAREPDLGAVIQATRGVAKHLTGDQLVVLESTTFPGTTLEVIRPIVEENGLVVGRDVFVAFSPERIDPGNRRFTTTTIPKLVGGVTPACTELAAACYRSIVGEVYPVSSPTVAEMSKLLENSFRAVNIALINEVALICEQIGIDVWEVIEAAATKPFGFMAFHPGPGVGGHCIPLDPFYLSFKAREIGASTRMIAMADEINQAMPGVIVAKVADLLAGAGQSLTGARVLLLGVAYKPGVADARESPALELIELLTQAGAEPSYCDPRVPTVEHGKWRLQSRPFSEQALAEADCVVVVTNHADFDYQLVARVSRLVVDTRNALAAHPRPGISTLGRG